MLTEDTIVAIATPSGRGGVGIVRLSGAKAYNIALALTQRQTLTPRFAYFSPLFFDNKDVLDEGIVIYFKAPFSFTGEDVVEFQLHGSPIILDELIAICLSKGARLATHGEFSLRAYLNDKMDLTQAEAIADLINASSETAARMAMRSLQGDFSKRIDGLNQKIIYLRTYVEAMIDFPEEEIDTITFKTIETHFSAIQSQLNDILSVAAQGSLIREGITIVIAGRPNAGKSTLINALARRDVAIVTDVPGTTRDVMKEYLLLDDIPVHVLDTAGLRDSDDKVEQEGIKRAWDEIKKADCILLVNDSQTSQSSQLEDDIRGHVEGIPIIKVWNKIDLGDNTLITEGIDEVKISAKNQLGLVALKTLIKQKIGYQPVEGQFLARRRHLDALNLAKSTIKNAHEHITTHTLELLAEDLRLAHEALSSITGEFSSDDLLGEIFSSFCIGK